MITIPFVVVVTLFVVGVTVLTMAMIRFRVLPFVALLTAGIVLPFVTPLSNSWFFWGHVYAVILLACLWAWLRLSFQGGKWTRLVVGTFPVLFAIHILMLGLSQFEMGAFINAICLAIVALTVPLGWGYDAAKRMIGFRDGLWIGAYTCGMAYASIFDASFSHVGFGAVVILLIAVGAALVLKDTLCWMTWRIYTLVLFTFQDVLFHPFLSALYPAWLHSDSRLLLKGTFFEYGLLAITGVFVFLILEDRVKQKVVQSTLKTAA